ncbi:hypothetical protein PSI9734_01774 [Pseudidiomarina piscicola]|uniref:Type I restriction modification DNA specificity domain-containing protein n=1 Tax=Pseudidiomarina piscicola TaxID=2614830 RepID=A0A6S6WQ45_9GAMM|nr:restriction endonuclease subunit S [Pseudidiomarina piscicola]CAB0151386.1 hypothetical protein PSI9734_01774 [Pseudidiomarina piscicola]VZT40866.1 hypothetical protein PSI9734_01774 [Pseudomonas aeruginosa]
MLCSSWTYVPGNEYCTKITDGTHDSPKQAEYGKPLITSKHIKGDVIDFDTAYLISEHDFNEINKRSKVDQWDVIISMIGAYCGFCFIESNEEIDYAVKNVGLFKAGSEVNAKWLYYYLKSPIGKAHLDAVKSGSTQPYIALGALRNLPILVPKKDEVKEKIVAILDAIDTKVRVNNRINAELEAMAKTLYDYWFVQFGFPDANGKPYKSSGGTMVYNPTLKREIPEGWEDSTIGEIEPNIVTGKTPSKDNPEYFGGNVPFITIGDIRGNTYIVSTEETLTASGAATQKNKFLPEDSICVTCIASPGLVGFVTTPAQTNQQINSVVCSNKISKYYLYFAIKGYFEGAKAKTGNTFSNMNKGDFSAIVILKPSDQVLQDYHQKAYPLFEQIKLKSLENKQLVKLRDWLLPMLMNGQVTIK